VGASGPGVEVGVVFSGHLLSEELGHGGQSRVFRAVPEAGGAAVAIKVAIDPALVTALRAEGDSLRRLTSPRFVRILEEHLDADPPFFVLELCPGGDLGRALAGAPGGRLPPARVLGLARGVLEGVTFAHEEGVVHGDLKPENILLDAEGAPKIADLGLSRARRRELVVPGLSHSLATERDDGKVRGTFDYLAPEVRAGGPIDPRSDVYALGVLLYELLVGARPLGLFRLPGEVLGPEAGVPRALDRVIGRALLADPTLRYPDAGVMLVDLELGDVGLPAAVLPDAGPAGENPLIQDLGEADVEQGAILTLVPALAYFVIPGLGLLFAGRLDLLLALVGVVVALAAGLWFAQRWLRVLDWPRYDRVPAPSPPVLEETYE